MVSEGIVNVIHYLDDFFFCGQAGSPTCGAALDTALPLCERLGFSVAPDKVVGPTTVLTFLGIEIDSWKQELRLPAEKLSPLTIIGLKNATQQNMSFNPFWFTSTMHAL